MLFQDKVVLVTGGSSGIGRATSLAFAKAGAKVLIADVDADKGGETLKLISEAGGIASYITADVSNADEVKTMVNAAVGQFGALHIAVNNAGIGGKMEAIHEADEATFQQVMDINVKGVWLCMKYEIPTLLRSGGGSIVNVASVAGLLGFRGGSIYSASKHAVIGLTKSSALEFARLGIRVNAICPSFINTPMVNSMFDEEVPENERWVQKASPMKRLGHADEVAETILWLASDKASFVNGVALAIDGGMTAM